MDRINLYERGQAQLRRNRLERFYYECNGQKFIFQVFVGSGGKKEAEVVGLGLNKLTKSQIDELDKAKKYALDQSVRYQFGLIE